MPLNRRRVIILKNPIIFFDIFSQLILLQRLQKRRVTSIQAMHKAILSELMQ